MCRALLVALGLGAVLVLPACGGGGGGGSSGTTSGGSGTPVSISGAHVVWLDSTTMVWPSAASGHTYKLFYAANGQINVTSTAVTMADNTGDTLAVGTLSGSQLAQYPQYSGAVALTVPSSIATQIKEVLTDEIVVVQYTGSTAAAATFVQDGPVLDAVYGTQAASAALGLSFDAVTDAPTFRVWAPTAQSVKLNVYDTNAAVTPIQQQAMTLDPVTGIWSYSAPDASWTNVSYYTYTVAAFAGSTLYTSEVSDPYSLSLNANGVHSMVVNLADAAAQPSGWPGAQLPTAAVPTDSVIYELHIRDFSMNDATVPAAHQGKYLAFTDTASLGMTHLAALSAAGLTHVHLLPAFDIASVNELTCTNPVIPASMGAGTEAETAVKNTENSDCFNWGYDPFHYGAPEGSYATDPNNGLVRVREFRQMVQALHGIGLRVVMDVVYNHTSASGQDAQSVLDKVVPGYYHRLDSSGAVENYSCCQDTATERVMMEKLMTDTLKIWAGQYKVDGFRFDVMGMIPKAAMTRALAAVDAVAAADGRGHTYFYGEGWAPNSAVSNVITPATQANLAGTGIGTFNDRMRDAVRGGGPFDTGASIVANQGFISGLCYDVNSTDTATCSGAVATDAAFISQNRASVSLAGNLASFPLRSGVTGAGVDYNGSPAGYTALPQENISYVSVHDNETLFDISEYKHPSTTAPADVARAQVVGLSLVLLSQGVPFLHAGDELLRSKSGDSNSYNSGDYFNRIFWDGSANGWATGLPPDNTGNNAANSTTLAGLLGSRVAPNQAATLAVDAAVIDFLRIRKATDLFRLTRVADINACVSFPDQGAQVHGLIVERIQGTGCVASTTSGFKSVVVLFNASKTAQSFSIPAYAGKLKGTASGNVYLHAAQLAGTDTVLQGGWNFTATASTGTFTAPARSTAVFVEYD